MLAKMLLLSGRIIKDATSSSVQKCNTFTEVNVFFYLYVFCLFKQPEGFATTVMVSLHSIPNSLTSLMKFY